MLDVLLLLAVTGRLLEGTDDEGRGGGNNRDRGLTVLDGELDGDTETFLLIARLRVSDSVSSMTCSGKRGANPVTGSLGNIFTCSDS